MSKHSLAIIPTGGDQTGLEKFLDSWKQAEEGFTRGKLLAQVMQGLCLSELRKLHGGVQGRRSDLTSPKLSEKLAWPLYVANRFGFSDDKARNLMAMAEAAKPRLRKLAADAQSGLAAILDKPVSKLTPPELTALKAANLVTWRIVAVLCAM